MSNLVNSSLRKQVKDKKVMDAKYESKMLAKDESFNPKQGKGITLPKGNSPINK